MREEDKVLTADEVILAGVMKKIGKDYQDVTWEELNDMFGKPYKNGDSYRCAVKRFQAEIREIYGEDHEYSLPCADGDFEKFRKLELEKYKIRSERNKLSALRNDLYKRIREDSRFELLVEEYIRAVKDASKNFDGFKFQKLEKQKDDVEYVLAIGDGHYGKQFETFFNSYNTEIARERFNKLANEIYDLVLEKHINTLHILDLGDMIEGLTLRISQLQSLQTGLVDQTIEFMQFFASWLTKLSEFVNIKYRRVKSSNHSQIRPFGSKPNEFVKEDMGRIVYTYLKDVLKNNPRIQIMDSESLSWVNPKNNIEETFPVFKIFDYNVIMLHGHEFKDWNNVLKDLSWKYRTFFDYGFVGHRHTNGTIPSGEGASHNVELIKVPSIMGTDPYADSLNVGNKAGATFVEFTRKQGKRCIIDIILN